MRHIVHIDMDCFYVSVERLLDPSLEGKPVAVGGAADGRGVVSSASYEARKFGVRSAMPMGRALQLCPQLLVVTGRYSRYSEFAEQIESILSQFTPLVQMASQDEAYCDLTGTERLWGPALSAAQAMRSRIFDETKLPCSLGLAPNRMVAKIGSGHCKPRGLMWVPHGSEAKFLAPLSVGVMPGIGTKSEQRLNDIGIRTLGELAALAPDQAERHFGRFGPDMVARAQGIDDTPVAAQELPKSMGGEETFERDSDDPAFVDTIISALAERIASRLRKQQARAATISIKYRYSDFETHTAAATLPAPTDDELAILEAARRLLKSKWERGRALRLVGVAGTNLVFGKRQLDFFAEAEEEKRTRLHEAIDRVRGRHGFDILRRGASAGGDTERSDRAWG